MSYNYLFPYEKVPAGSKILIYGAGDLGQDYLFQMQITHYCEVVAVADRNYSKYPSMVVPVISPSSIHEYEFDYAVIALKMEAAYQELVRVLHIQGVKDDKIVCIFERNTRDISIVGTSGDNAEISGFAFNSSDQSIAILAAGGFGDMVMQKRFVMEMIKYAPDCKIDFFNIKSIELLKYLYTDVSNVNLVVDDLGYRYRTLKDNYTLAFDIEGCHFIRVDVWDEQTADKVFTREFVRRISMLKANSDAEGIGVNTPHYLTMTRRRFKGLNAYNGFNYDGAFEIKDKKVDIPLDLDQYKNFEELNLGSYITVNYGNGDSEVAAGIAKSWPADSFEAVIKGIKDKYPQINVIQLGGASAYRLKGVDKSILGEDFRLVLHILNNSLLHLDIEGGLVHIATQLGTKCVVLFGPTVPDYYGYEQNINIRAGKCRECWGLYSDVNKCARDLKEPECMKAITSEMVLEEVNKYLEEL